MRPHCSFDLHFSNRISHVEHLITCLLVIYNSSVEKWILMSSAHFLIELFLCYCIVWAVCVFWRLSACHLHCLQICLPSRRFSFLFFFIVSLAVQKLLSLIRSHLQNGVSNSSRWRAVYERGKASRAYCGIEMLRKRKWWKQTPIHYMNMGWVQKPSEPVGDGISETAC